MPNAIALNSIQFNLARVIGPVLGGLALTQLGAAWCFGLNGLSFIAVIISLSLLHVRFIPGEPSETMLTSMKQGIGFIRTQRAMEALIVLAFCMTGAGHSHDDVPAGLRQGRLPRRARAPSRSSWRSRGWARLLGALIVAGFGKIRNKGRVALLMLVCLGAASSAFAALAATWCCSCVLLFLSGAAMIAVFATISSLVQLITTDEMRGRVMSVYNVAFRGGMPFGSLITGWLVPIFTAPAVLAVNGAAAGVGPVLSLAGQRRVAAL